MAKIANNVLDHLKRGMLFRSASIFDTSRALASARSGRTGKRAGLSRLSAGRPIPALLFAATLSSAAA